MNMPFSPHASEMHFKVLFRDLKASDPQIFHEGVNGGDNLLYNIKTENKATRDHL